MKNEEGFATYVILDVKFVPNGQTVQSMPAKTDVRKFICLIIDGPCVVVI